MQSASRAAESVAPEAPRYTLEPDGTCRIDGYDRAPAFASFLPAVAGPHGVPLWCMYVNRAQAVASFGVHHKDQPIVEYLPANWAYQLAGVQGFRTFCRIDGAYYEPFRDGSTATPQCRRTLRIRADQVELQETNPAIGLSFDVEYFSPVNRPLGTLARRVTITNDSDRRLTLEALDGLPLIIPAGFTDHGLKHLRHIMEAYASVRLVDGVPYYAAKVVAHDEAEVTEITHGNFYAAWVGQNSSHAQAAEPFVDPHAVFGAGHDLVTPRRFVEHGLPDRAAQVWENRLPCALVPVHGDLAPGESLRIVALIGFAPHEEVLTSSLAGFGFPDGFDAALAESHALLDDVTSPALLATNVPVLDAYARQNYLDNVLRGGVPHLLPSRSGMTPVHLYSRRHGDLERDYNFFVLPPHPLSSGAGNFRDICQNRRHDAWIYSDIADRELRMFLSLLQPDGYNPLSIEGYQWQLPADTEVAALLPDVNADAAAGLRQILARPFHPGELVHWAQMHGAVPEGNDWLHRILAACDTTLVAEGHEGGYWIDHWTYLVDLLESFAGVYPDRIVDALTRDADVGWFDDGAYVKPRAEKYVRRGAKLLQLDAVADGPRAARPLPPVTPLGKLCALLAVKAVSFDRECRGIEMEAGRPGWNDSLNGLPGMFGSSSCEAAELARLAGWLRRHLPASPDTLFPAEVAEFVEAVTADLELPAYDWNRAADLREAYRARVRSGASGETAVVTGARLDELLAGVERRARAAVERAVDPDTGLVHTYFAAAPKGPQDLTQDDPPPTVSQSPRSEAEPGVGFDQWPLPLFLEGQVHWLRLQESIAGARRIHESVRASALLDRKLAMYKLNECLEACPPEIGRARTFTRGWFENESIWLHMSYKYLLELLRSGLHQEFFADARTMLVPFMDPAIYGRSILENSSFIASSANPDGAVHGRGFIARLSGSTAEFIHIALLLTVGPRPMRAEPDGGLTFRLEPALPGEWFTNAPHEVHWRGEQVQLPAGTLACALFSRTLLVYHNPARRNTFGPDGARPVRYEFDGGQVVEGGLVPEPTAGRVRGGAFRRIDVHLG